MRRLAHGIVDFIVGDDIWIAAMVLVLLLATAALVRIGGEPWWLLPVGVPAALWSSLLRGRRRAQREISAAPLQRSDL
jgi:hypothetical protein